MPPPPARNLLGRNGAGWRRPFGRWPPARRRLGDPSLVKPGALPETRKRRLCEAAAIGSPFICGGGGATANEILAEAVAEAKVLRFQAKPSGKRLPNPAFFHRMA